MSMVSFKKSIRNFFGGGNAGGNQAAVQDGKEVEPKKNGLL